MINMDKMKEQEYREALASLAKTDREALAAMIVDYVAPQHIAVDYISMLLDTRSLNPGDQLFRRMRRGITVRSFYPGAVHLSNEVTVEDRAWYHLTGLDVRVHVNEWDLASGQIGTMADIEAEMKAKIQDYLINQVITSLGTLWTAANTPNNWVSVGGQLTAAALETAIDSVNYRVGGTKAVVGVKRLMTPITKFAQYQPYTGAPNAWGVPVPSAIEEVRKTGFVGTYYGVPIIGLPQQWDYPTIDRAPLLPENFVLVIGNNVGEFITYGEPKWKQWTNFEPTPPTYNIEVYQQWGMMITNQEGVYIIDDLVFAP